MRSVEWRWVHGYENKYLVSNTGLIKSVARTVSANTDRFKRNLSVNERILKQRIDRYGYRVVGLNNGTRKVKWFKVHRIVARAYLGESDLTVNHKNFDKTDNSVDNLEYLSSIENTQHFNRFRKRKIITGEKHHSFKLTDRDKDNICIFKELGFDMNIIATCYNIHKHTIYKVLSKRNL